MRNLWISLIFCFWGWASAHAQSPTHAVAPLRPSHIRTHLYYQDIILPKQIIYTQPYPAYFWGVAIPDSIGKNAYTMRQMYGEGGIKRTRELYEGTEKDGQKVADFIDADFFKYPYAGHNMSDYYSNWVHPTGIYSTGFEPSCVCGSCEDGATKIDSGRCEVILRKQNFKGERLWQTTIGTLLTNSRFDSIEKIDMRCNEKGDVFIIKSIRDAEKNTALLLSKLDGKTGSFVLHNQELPTKNATIVHLMPDNKDGLYLLLANAQADNFILQKYNSKGNLSWEKTPFAPASSGRGSGDTEIIFLFDNAANLWLLQVTDGARLLPNAKKAAPLAVARLSPKGKILSHDLYGTFFNKQPFVANQKYQFSSKELNLSNLAQDPSTQKIYLELYGDYVRTDLVSGKLQTPPTNDYYSTALVFTPKGKLEDSYFVLRESPSNYKRVMSGKLRYAVQICAVPKANSASAYTGDMKDYAAAHGLLFREYDKKIGDGSIWHCYALGLPDWATEAHAKAYLTAIQAAYPTAFVVELDASENFIKSH